MWYVNIQVYYYIHKCNSTHFFNFLFIHFNVAIQSSDLWIQIGLRHWHLNNWSSRKTSLIRTTCAPTKRAILKPLSIKMQLTVSCFPHQKPSGIVTLCHLELRMSSRLTLTKVMFEMNVNILLTSYLIRFFAVNWCLKFQKCCWLICLLRLNKIIIKPFESLLCQWFIRKVFSVVHSRKRSTSMGWNTKSIFVSGDKR